MGTVEVIKKSHTWGHIPHSNREPIELPENYLSEKVNIKETIKKIKNYILKIPLIQ